MKSRNATLPRGTSGAAAASDHGLIVTEHAGTKRRTGGVFGSHGARTTPLYTAMTRARIPAGSGPLTMVIIVGFALSLAAYFAVQNHEHDRHSAAFGTQAGDYAKYIADGFAKAIYAIESVGALYQASGAVTPTQFYDFCAPLLTRFPTITALGWVPRVSPEQREMFEHHMRQSIPEFRITEIGVDQQLVAAGPHDVHFPVLLIAPFVGNEAARGFDLYSNPVRRAAIDSAIRSGKTTSTARIRLVQERGHQYSVLLIHPVFARAADGDTGSLRGLASAVYRIGDGVERALAELRPAEINAWLFDRSAAAGEQLMYFHAPSGLPDNRPLDAPAPPDSGILHSHHFRLGERNFELVLSPTPAYQAGQRGYLAWLTLGMGLVITALLAAYITLMVRRSGDLLASRRALEHEIGEREHAERQLRRANDELKVLSREDPLMGIANRRYFNEYFASEWKRAMRDQTSLSLLIGDIDHFKAFNDDYGHLAGDQCLQAVAEVLRDALERPGDLVARYGGEEIALVLPSTTAAGAMELAERIRVRIASMPMPDAATRPVTISIGVGSIVPQRDMRGEDFIKRVDDALYRAKQLGRNRSVPTEPEPVTADARSGAQTPEKRSG